MRTKNKPIFAAAGLILSLLIALVAGFTGINALWVNAADSFTSTDTKVTAVKTESGYVWFGLSNSDYQTTASKKLLDYVSKLSTLNTLSKIEIDGNAISKTYDKCDPYINLWNKIPGSFTLNLGSPTKSIKIMAGCQFPSLNFADNEDNNAIYTTTEDAEFVYDAEGAKWDKVLPEQNITSEISFDVRTDAKDRLSARYDFYSKVRFWDAESGKWLMDNKPYLQEHLFFGDKTVKQINDSVDDSEWEYKGFPEIQDGKKHETYAVPIRALVSNKDNGNQITLFVHEEYLKTVGTVEFGIKETFFIETDTEKFVLGSPVTATEHKVIFQNGDGSEHSYARVMSGQSVSKPTETPVKQATAAQTFKFIGWFNGETKFDFATPVTQDISLRAKFEASPREYTVTFEIEGDLELRPDGLPEKVTVHIGEKLTLGDYSVLDYTYKIFSGETEITETELTVTHDITLRVVYTAVPEEPPQPTPTPEVPAENDDGKGCGSFAGQDYAAVGAVLLLALAAVLLRRASCARR